MDNAAKLTIHRLQNEIESLRARVAELEGLLKVAKCPDDSCDGKGSIAHGPYSDGSYEQEQCQWCDEKKTALSTPTKAKEPSGE